MTTTAPTTGGRVTALRPEHAEEVLATHQLGIEEGNATFETAATDWKRFDAGELPRHHSSSH
jgi:phosphinothricin acetyltransferase